MINNNYINLLNYGFYARYWYCMDCFYDRPAFELHWENIGLHGLTSDFRASFFLFKNLVFTYFEEKAVLWNVLIYSKTICILLTTIYGLHIFLFIQVLNLVIAYDFWKWKIKWNFKIKTKGIEQTYVSGLYTILNDGKQN